MAKRLTNIFHDHHQLTVSSLHVHLDHDNCLEVSVLKGPVADVKYFAEHVIAERSVRHGELAVIPLLPSTPATHAGHSHGDHP